jgi:hypothetical protein
MFLKTVITHRMLLTAVCRSVAMGSLRLSFMSGDRNIVGLVGEEIYSQHAPNATRMDTYDYDFIVKGKKVDVKTRIVTSEPKPSYEMAILLTRANQEVDFYVFCSVSKQFTEGWLMGFLSKDEFLERAQYVEEGSPMPQGGHYRSNAHVIQLDQIRTIEK